MKITNKNLYRTQIEIGQHSEQLLTNSDLSKSLFNPLELKVYSTEDLQKLFESIKNEQGFHTNKTIGIEYNGIGRIQNKYVSYPVTLYNLCIENEKPLLYIVKCDQ